MAQERGKLPGWLIPVAVLAVIAAIAIAFMIGRTSVAQPDQNRIAAPAEAGAPGRAAAEAQQANASGGAGPRAMGADFLVTDRLLAHPPNYDDLQNETMATSVCLGQTLRIGNVSSRRVGLIDTPDESDASAELGFVDPGAVFTMEPREAGTFFISAAGVDGLLFRYSAERCPPGRSRP
jgi:hypothetical protein